MKIAICGSIAFAKEILDAAAILEQKGHEIFVPYSCQEMRDGKLSYDEYMAEKEQHGDLKFRALASEDMIKHHYNYIKESDAILVLNYDKKGIKSYVGGNTLLELGFAHVLDKKIFLLNEIPEMHYKDEIVAMNPIILGNDLSKLN